MSRKIMLLLFCGFAIAWAAGCSSSTKDKKSKVAIKGTVKLDGKPMSEGEIRFDTTTGEPPVLIPVKDGSFSGEAFEGKNRVEVYMYKIGPPAAMDPLKAPTKTNTIPTKYNGPSSTLSAEVSASASDFKFDVTSK